MKSPDEMSAAEINRELDALDKKDSALTREMIDAGYGHVRFSDTEKLAPEFYPRQKAISDRKRALSIEVQMRAGPGMYRLPRGFGPRNKNPMGARREVKVYSEDRRTVLATVSDRATSIGAAKAAKRESAYYSTVNGERAWVSIGKRVPNPVRDPAHRRLLKGLSRHFMSDERKERKERKRNPLKFDRCVRDVKRRGSAVNAYAVCTAALFKPGRTHGPRVKNPSKANSLTDEARAGYYGNENPWLYSSPAWYAHALGRYMHDTGRSIPTDVRMGRGDSIRANNMRFTFKLEKGQGISFERVE